MASRQLTETRLGEITGDEHAFLEAHRVERDLSIDILLHWSTKLDSFALIRRCTTFEHAPGQLQSVEIVANEEVLRVRSFEELEPRLAGCSVVRFNVNDWSVIWLAGGEGGLAEVQAIAGHLPKAMIDMVAKSIFGISPQKAASFVRRLLP